MIAQVLVITAAGLLLVGHVVATVFVARAEAYTTVQKRTQIALIWLFPLLGALWCAYFLRQDRRRLRYRRQVGNNTSITDGDAISFYVGAHHRGGR